MVSDLLAAVEGLTALLEAKTKRSRTRRTFYVGAFSNITSTGKLRNPEAIDPGDNLYVQRGHEPGAGLISKNPTGRLLGVAISGLAAGAQGRVKTALYEKLWVTDSNPCEICDENAIAGWIPADEEFPSGDDEPDAHINCKCSLDTRRTDDEED